MADPGDETPQLRAGEPPVVFDADGAPRSRRYGDVYFSKAGGHEESRAVFLAGCGLPQRWAGRRAFTVAELGFGTGLNIAALLELWRAERPPGAHLSIFSVEAEPLGAADAGRALAAFPELADAAALLTGRWPGRARGFRRVDLPELGASLDVAVMDAHAALAAWGGRADAWFLDGFAPAVNPQMWTDALMALVAARSAPGARAATYTVAGHARRALAAAGFAVERRPGFGAKRQRLEARLPGEPRADRAAPRVAVIGAGIAGAALARAFAALGAAPQVFDAQGPGAGASGMPAALVTPRLDAGLGPAAQLHAQALARAAGLYDALPGAVTLRGVLQLEAAERDAARFAAIAASDLFEPGALELQSAEAASARLGEPGSPGLLMHAARVVAPAAVLRAWLPHVAAQAIAAVEPAGAAWRLLGEDGSVVAEADVVCLAAGASLAQLWPDAPIQPVRGQLSWADGVAAPAAAAWGAYVAPTPAGLVFGATHDRGDATADWRAGDDARNLSALAERLPQLAARLSGVRTHGRAAVRAATPDRLPIAGALMPGLCVLGGLGARGFALAPLVAEHVAAEALGAPSPLPHPLARIVDPGRFAERARRRGVAQPARTV
jgi:tRNA 5-methylaminomethyl-2-thiouridine biosynthesis bifunctional protein